MAVDGLGRQRFRGGLELSSGVVVVCADMPVPIRWDSGKSAGATTRSWTSGGLSQDISCPSVIVSAQAED